MVHVGTDNAGVSRFVEGEWEYHPLTSAQSVWHSSNGTVWVGGNGAVSRYRHGHWHATVPPRVGARVRGLHASDGSLWLWSQAGGRVFRLALATTATVYNHPDSLLVGPEGQDGSMWFRTQTSAVRMQDNRWLSYGLEDGFLNGGVRALERTPDGEIWAIGFHRGEGAAARFRSEKWDIFTERDGLIDTPIGLLPTRDGGLWVTGLHESECAVTRFETGSGWERFTTVLKGPEGVGQAYEASDGTVWFGAEIDQNQGTGLYRYDPNHAATGSPPWIHFDETDGLTTAIPRFAPLDGSARGFTEWPTGTLWVGTSLGIYRVDLASLPQHRTFQQLLTREDFGIRLPKFHNLTPADDALWFHPFYPRGGGVVRHDGQAWKTFRRRDGSFWINTNTGVAQVRYREVEAPETFLEPATESVASDGTILLRFSGRTRWDATSPEDLAYAWRLKGSEWTETRNALVSLTALDPGRYTFEVKARAPTLRVDQTPAVHTFVVAAPWWRNPVVAGPGILLVIAVIFQSARVVRGKRQLQQSVDALSAANHELFAVNKALQRDRAVERIRSQVQSMDRAEDFEKVLSELTTDLKEVGLTFDACEIDVLDEPVDAPSIAYFEERGFRYTTYSLDPDGNVAYQSYHVQAPFPTVNQETIERFVAGEPWQALIGGKDAIVEVPASNYGRLRLTSSQRTEFTDDETETLKEFASAIALGYARYLDIREIQLQTERKSAFLAAMSHELRTPMNAIKGFTNLVLRRGRDELSERNQENLEKVSQSSDHLLAMINDLLDLSKIEAGRIDVNVETFDIAELIQSCCDTVNPLVKESVELRHEVAAEIGVVNTDRSRTQQMVINLLSNAIKFTDQGEVRVEANRRSRGLQPVDQQDDLVIAVSDTGKGIPEDELLALFDEYRQVEGQSDSDVQKGTGLGLSITKKFAELLGGSITVESEVGKGTTFTITIPSTYSV